MSKKKNPLAVALGKLAAGKPKNYSAAEKQKRAERLALVRPKKKDTSEGDGAQQPIA